MHTALQLLSCRPLLPCHGRQIGESESRLDFDIPRLPELDRDGITSKREWRSSARYHPVSQKWITDEELDAQPKIVRRMAVKPPRRFGPGCALVRIGGRGSPAVAGDTHDRLHAK